MFAGSYVPSCYYNQLRHHQHQMHSNYHAYWLNHQANNRNELYYQNYTYDYATNSYYPSNYQNQAYGKEEKLDSNSYFANRQLKTKSIVESRPRNLKSSLEKHRRADSVENLNYKYSERESQDFKAKSRHSFDESDKENKVSKDTKTSSKQTEQLLVEKDTKINNDEDETQKAKDPEVKRKVTKMRKIERIERPPTVLKELVVDRPKSTKNFYYDEYRPKYNKTPTNKSKKFETIEESNEKQIKSTRPRSSRALSEKFKKMEASEDSEEKSNKPKSFKATPDAKNKNLEAPESVEENKPKLSKNISDKIKNETEEIREGIRIIPREPETRPKILKASSEKFKVIETIDELDENDTRKRTVTIQEESNTEFQTELKTKKKIRFLGVFKADHEQLQALNQENNKSENEQKIMDDMMANFDELANAKEGLNFSSEKLYKLIKDHNGLILLKEVILPE